MLMLANIILHPPTRSPLPTHPSVPPMKVFITGASGYIGSALTTELLKHGHTVLGLARSDASAEKIKALGAEVHRGDTSDLDSIRAGATAADAVVHTAFDHSFTDFEGAQKKDNETIEAIGAVLAGTWKPFITSSGTLIGAAGLNGTTLTEDYVAPIEGIGAGRALSEKITLELAQKGVRSAVVRFSPTVHGGDLKSSSFVRQMTAAAKKHGISAYVGDGSARWPAANVLDVAVLLRLILETGPGGLVYHAVADEGNRNIDIATAIGACLGVPIKSITQGPEAMAHFGFISHLMTLDNPTSSVITQERTGWKLTHQSMLEELKAGNPIYY
jgi:nucleoside-diphosphate-sugar epimerase